MAFENFPYTNFHEINLDWIVARVKEAYSASNPPDYPVKSVNGMTGDVIIAIPANLVSSVNGETGDVVLYRNPLTQFPATDEQRWNLFRICDGDERGIEFDEDGAHRIEGTRRILIYDEENQPDYPVTSVNGQTGDVRITAGVNSVNGKTGNVVTPFVNPNTDILKLDSNSNTVLWGISRDVAGGNVALYISRGTGTPQAFIRYTPDQGEAINLPLLSSADIPESAGVVSINTKTGVVTLYGTDMLLSNGSSVSVTDAITNETAARIAEDARLAEQVELNNSIVQYNVDKIIDTSLWARGSYYSGDGNPQTTGNRCRTRDYIPDDCLAVIAKNNIVLRLYAWENDVYIGLYNTEGNFATEFGGDYPAVANMPFIDLTKIKEQYPTYKYKIVAQYMPESSITVSAMVNVEFWYSMKTSIENQIDSLEDTVTTLLATVDQIEEDTEGYASQISALQAADTTHNQQISELQAADSTHNQQISALQTSQATQDQQISELYTRTGVYVISISNANTLPLRYPTSGTDSKIKDTNKVVSMDLSLPGAQMSDWTITTYEGYLEITGTINTQTNIILYLA